eukprot:TRINITY_DN11143_c0_g1_i9.p1 TRINITY_DN11143_c0_g1~~TRINITY_DN11143_c0_g1_i9.p1  ORF type:complete len:509 (+),score=112.35 TRINITY_DN11143_c0_g1_i9:415-1941(+)
MKTKAKTWKEIAMGKSHALLHSKDNTVWSVGRGNSGQLGIPTFAIYNAQNKSCYQSDKELPFTYEFNGDEAKEFNPKVAVPVNLSLYSGRKVVKVACGKYHSLVLTEARQILSFGLFTRGRLGVGRDISANLATPYPINSLKDITDISSGGDFSLALDDKGNVFGWGSNKHGCVGNDSLNDEWDPVVVPNVAEAVLVAAGPSHCAAINKQGRVYMWGNGSCGQLGMKGANSEKVVRNPRVNMLTGKKVIALALGKRHSLALTQAFEVYAWGSNDKGQLGIISLEATAQPTMIKLLEGKGISRIACGKNHSCGLSLSGLLYTWGDNTSSQLGRATEPNLQGVPMVVKEAMGKAVMSVCAWGDCTAVVESAGTAVEKDEESFKQWKNSVILEEQKEIRKLIKNEESKKDNVMLKESRKPDNQSTKRTIIRNSRKKLEREGPMLVTKGEKIYKFNRPQGEESTVIVFKETSDNEFSRDTIAGTLYEKFWMQEEWFGKTKNNAIIFFGDKEE